MANLPEALITIFKEIGLTREQATWDCHGTPVALHKALEQGWVTRSNGLSVRLQLTTIRIATPMQWQRSAQKTV